MLSADAFARMTQTLAASMTLSLIAAASANVWTRLRDGWLRNLREGIGLTDLWTSAEAALKSDAAGLLEDRLLGDPDVAATLLDVDDIAAILEIREPSFGPLLGRYFARHRDRITASDALLLAAATHPLPEVRTPALALTQTRPVGLAFALGLMESKVPASVSVGGTWFETTEEPDLLTRALALCDSPTASVRRAGQKFVRTHRDALPMERLSAALVGNEPAPGFDREILRTRQRSRQAKELVKQRQEQQTVGGSVDVETLLALARGASTPRDADWALAQLVRRAMAGEVIDGLVIESGESR
jgi:hypothetical protein